jgi:hypothetical protein
MLSVADVWGGESVSMSIIVAIKPEARRIEPLKPVPMSSGRAKRIDAGEFDIIVNFLYTPEVWIGQA